MVQVFLKLIKLYVCGALLLGSAYVSAQTNIEGLREKGKELYFERVSCWVCHGESAQGVVGPSLQYGPTPAKILEMLRSVPQMAVVNAELKPSNEDLMALSIFIHSLGGNSVPGTELDQWREDLAQMAALGGKKVEFEISERDAKVMEIEKFDSVTEDWTRKAKQGSLKRDYAVRLVESYESGERVFNPEPGMLYFYENTGTGASMAPKGGEVASTSQVVVGDARTKKIITSAEIPKELKGAVHTTVLSPDGRYVYIVGPNARPPVNTGAKAGNPMLRTSATILKVDAFTLNPVKQLAVGGRLHHGQIFQDKYILMDTFISDPDGLDVFLFDPETDEIIGGISTEDLGGSNYTSWTDDEFIYLLMQPGNDGGMLLSASLVASGQYTAYRPFWIAKINPENWEVVAEFPFSGYRGDWVAIDAKKEFLYVPAAGSSNVTKLSSKTGEIAWSSPAGIGPYGAALTADGKELWVSNKGEGTGMIGRTVTILDAESGRPIDTLFSGYKCDHVLLAPNGKEMWVTSNGEGRIYVFDVKTREQTDVIDMPQFGDAHGLVWVSYDQDGQGKVVRDQGGFHNGVHPALGRPLN